MGYESRLWVWAPSPPSPTPEPSLKLQRRPAPIRGHRGPPGRGISHIHRLPSGTSWHPLLSFKLSPPSFINFLCY